MRRVFILITAFIVIGCTWDQVDLTFDILDIIAGEETNVIHSGTVERVEYSQESTTIHFDGGISYELKGYACCPVPGNEGKIIRNENGKLDFD